ncbi:MAG: T9SS type A sorting domain-containing protein, partial [Bacteroidetes bacterium]|nr:T9SS type A sorting domain-containing protein [Bacteroidota bacterium]
TIMVVTNCPESAIKIFPNPATSVVHVQGVAAGDEVKIMDALGQVVTSAVAPGNITTLDLTPYTPGVYSVMVTHGTAMTKAGTVVKQ